MKQMKKTISVILCMAIIMTSFYVYEPKSEVVAKTKVTTKSKKPKLYLRKVEDNKNKKSEYIAIKNKKAKAKYKFSSSNKKVVTVNSKGKIVRKSKGIAYITVKEVYKKKTKKIGRYKIKVTKKSSSASKPEEANKPEKPDSEDGIYIPWTPGGNNKPTEPTNPTDPTDPTDPNKPVNPSKPGKPSGDEIIVKGKVDVKYVDETGKIIKANKTISDLNVLDTHQISAEIIDGYTLQGDYVQIVKFAKGELSKTITFKYIKDENSSKEVYNIDLNKFGINNEGKDATKTTEGINKAIREGIKEGYKKIKLPDGYYVIDSKVSNPVIIKNNAGNTWKYPRVGIALESNMQFDITGCTLKTESTNIAYTSVISIGNCENTKIIGGTIIGDKKDHYYGTRLNESGTELESGDFDPNTGMEIPNSKNNVRMRTKNFIDTFVNQDGSTKPLPNNFFIMPLANTTMNTVDGGCRYIYCYDENGKYLGMSEGGSGFIKAATLKPGTKKIKVSFRNETRTDASFYITEEKTYPTYEFGAGVAIGASNNIEVVGSTIKDSTGDCIFTYPVPIKEKNVDNLKIIDCNLSGSRRQGISFVSTGENNLVKNTKISNIAGVDPQCGIDFEHYDYCKNTVIDGCTFFNNKKLDIINYNGTDIEVKNSKFSGLIAATYGTDMNIHDNVFEYVEGQDKIHKSAGVELGTDNNIVWNNKFYNSKFNVRGKGSDAYGNYVNGGKVVLYSSKKNVFEDVKIMEIKRGEGSDLVEGAEFSNCEVVVGTKRSDYTGTTPMTMRNCKFKNSKMNATGKVNFESCEFDNDTVPIQDKWAVEGTLAKYNKCKINAPNVTFLGKDLHRVNIFEECNITTKRDVMLTYNETSFIRCNIKFVTGDSDKTKTIRVNRGGYGYEKCPWKFTDTTFEATDPISVYANNGHSSNKAIGPVKLETK